MKVVFR